MCVLATCRDMRDVGNATVEQLDMLQRMEWQKGLWRAYHSGTLTAEQQQRLLQQCQRHWQRDAARVAQDKGAAVLCALQVLGFRQQGASRQAVACLTALNNSVIAEALSILPAESARWVLVQIDRRRHRGIHRVLEDRHPGLSWQLGLR